MPQKNNSLTPPRRARGGGRTSQVPPKVMTWKKASPVLIVCGVFDAVRFMFQQFWFFAPAITGLAVTAATSGILGDVGLGSTVNKFLAVNAGAGVGTLVALAAPELEVFGTVMAMVVGLAGWLTVGLWLILTNARILKENAGNLLWFVGSLLVSEIPIVGSVPALTGTMWRLYHVQIKKEKADLKKYEQQQAAQQLQERRQQAAQLMQYRAIQIAQAEQQDAANDEHYAEEEIPEEVRKSA